MKTWDSADFGSMMGYVLAAVAVAGGLMFLASLPGRRARLRFHPDATPIAVLGWLSLLVPPAWLVAWLWAGSRRRRRDRRMVVRVTPSRRLSGMPLQSLAAQERLFDDLEEEDRLAGAA